MRTFEEQQLQLHRARTGLIDFKKEVMNIIRSAKPISKDLFEILLEASRVSSDYQDSLTLNNLVIILGVELLQ